MHHSDFAISNSQMEYDRTLPLSTHLQKQAQSMAGPILRWHQRTSLASIAKAMDVPVVIATFRDKNYIQTVATYGLDLMNNLAKFANVCDKLCAQRAVVIPDARNEPEMATLAKHWPSSDICFLAGIPLRDAKGQRMGSLCVMNSSQAVAKRGISFRTLSDVGKAFAENGQLVRV